jgi:MFS family permease
MKRSRRFLLAFALCHAGGVVAYLPFLALLLPLKVAGLAGGARVVVLSAVLGGGAIAASLGNILAGVLIDRSQARGGALRNWIVLGTVATIASYGLIWAAHSPPALFAAIVLFQLAVNLLVAPVALIMVDEMPTAQKGLAGGLLTLGHPLAMLAATLLVLVYDRSEMGAYLAIGGAVTVLALPLLATRAQPAPPAPPDPATPVTRGDLTWLALSRLLLMSANSMLDAMLVYWFQALSRPLSTGDTAVRVGLIGLAAYAAAVPVAVTLGHRGQGKRVALGAALTAGLALAAMALAPGWRLAAIAYGLFVCAVQLYTSQQSAIVAHSLYAPRHRARDLGFQNLANTVPALIGPVIVLVLYVAAAMPWLIWTSAALAASSALLLTRARVA